MLCDKYNKLHAVLLSLFINVSCFSLMCIHYFHDISELLWPLMLTVFVYSLGVQ